MSTLAKKQSRDGVLRAGLVALVDHMANHELSAPLAIDFPRMPEDSPRIRVRLAGIGQQSAWLNTVDVVDETNETALSSDDYMRTTWLVSLPDTMTHVEFLGLRPRTLTLVEGPVAS